MSPAAGRRQGKPLEGLHWSWLGLEPCASSSCSSLPIPAPCNDLGKLERRGKLHPGQMKENDSCLPAISRASVRALCWFDFWLVFLEAAPLPLEKMAMSGVKLWAMAAPAPPAVPQVRMACWKHWGYKPGVLNA